MEKTRTRISSLSRWQFVLWQALLLLLLATDAAAQPTIPGVPGIDRLIGGDGQATISFSPPGSDGGSPIVGYTATSSPGGITVSSDTSPITVAGLRNGTPYTFTVTATNALGVGPPAVATHSITPMEERSARAGDGGVTVHDVTYGELTTLVAGGDLVPGDKYRLTDFRTRYTIPFTTAIHTGRTEALLLTANSDEALDLVAVSEDFPHDRIYYTIRNDVLFHRPEGEVDRGVDRGLILYRKDTLKNVEAWEDFRNVVFRRWENVAGSGIYSLAVDWQAPAGAGHRDLPMFADYAAVSEVSLNHHRDNDAAAGTYLSNVVFMSTAYKVKMPDGAENATFLSSVVELKTGYCSGGIFYGPVNSVELAEAAYVVATGRLSGVYSRKSIITLDGNFENVEILANYSSEVITGNYTNKVFGVDSDDLQVLAPADENDTGGNKDRPYILGSNHEDTLVIDMANLGGQQLAFVVINPLTPIKTYRIKPSNGGYVYLAFAGVNVNGRTWPLSDFNNMEGWKLSGGGGKVLTINGSASLGGAIWSSETQTSISHDIIDWQGGMNVQDGYNERYSLNSNQYAAVEQTYFDESTNTYSILSSLRATINDQEVVSSSYAGIVENLATNSTTDGIDKFGLYIASSGTFSGGEGVATNNYGLYVDTPSGADNNYAAVFAGGRVGVGTVTPDFGLDISGDARIEGSGALYFGGTGPADGEVNLYRGGPGRLQTDDQLLAGDGVVNEVNGGVCDDTIFTVDQDGLLCVDASNGRLYFRYGGAWHYASQAEGFQIPHAEAYSFDFAARSFDLQQPLAAGDFLVPFAEHSLSDGAMHGIYARWSDVKDTLLEKEKTQLDGLTLKTDQNGETIAGLRSSLDSQLATISGVLAGQRGEIAIINAQISEEDGRLASLANSVEVFGGQLAKLRAQQRRNANLDLAERNDLNDLKALLGVDLVSDAGDVHIAGTVSSAATATGAVAITVSDQGDKTIGQAVICPPALEADGYGECTVPQHDGDNDGLDDATGNPLNEGTRIMVRTRAVTEQSRIFLTPRTLLEHPLAVTAIQAGEYFQVETYSAVAAKTSFDWLLVEER